MAILTRNPLMQGARGSLGKLVFRTIRGQVVMSVKPRMPSSEKQSELQKLNRDKFRIAASYARRMMLDPVMKAFYWKRAKKLKLPNAYTAAIKDYMCKTKVQSVDLNKYTGKVGGTILIHAEKKHASVSEVKVTVMTKEGQEIEMGNATPRDSGTWIYKNTVRTNGPEGLRFIIYTKDVLGNWTRAIKTLDEALSSTYGWNRPPSTPDVRAAMRLG